MNSESVCDLNLDSKEWRSEKPHTNDKMTEKHSKITNIVDDELIQIECHAHLFPLPLSVNVMAELEPN